MSTFLGLASAPFIAAAALLTVLGVYGIRADETFGEIAGTVLLVVAAVSLWLGCVLLGLSKIIDQLDDRRYRPTMDRPVKTP